jgi:nicotinate-nucleotide adenylyltransferase
VGVLGGTFNPPHLGHLSAARHARSQLGLDRVLLVPVHTPPHKAAEHDPGPEQRLAMVCLLAAEEPWLQASDIETRRAGLSYTVDTLRELHARDPGAELTLIVGADMARTLPAWREPEEILRLARLAVAERDGTARAEIRDVLAKLDGQVAFLDMPEVPVSSSIVRERVAAGVSPADLVPAAVAGYIADHGLYAAARVQGAGR